MRDLIFRGKRNDNGEWLVSDSIIQHPNGVALYDEVANDIIDVVPETVGQFTGLTDVNGENIFEGDIVSSEYEYTIVYKAVVTYICAGFYGLNDNDIYDLDKYVPIKIRGNIHDGEWL